MTKITENTFPRYNSNNPPLANDPLYWTTLSTEEVYKGPIFSVQSVKRKSTDGREGNFSVVNSGSWINVIPLFIGTDGRKFFIMEKQFRHGSGTVTVEFPGGIVEKGEDPAVAAKRELEEETGIDAGKLTQLGEVLPNAAFIKSHGTIFLAEDLSFAGSQKLDPNEQIDIVCIPEEEALKKMGTDPFNHGGLLISAFFYMRRKLGLQGWQEDYSTTHLHLKKTEN